MRTLAFMLSLCACQAAADTVVATRVIRAQEIIPRDAVRIDASMRIGGAYDSLDKVVGQEARVAMYPGRPVLQGSVGEPALIERNQIVELVFARGGLRIVTEGRSLARGAAGERIRVMNNDSRTTLFGTVLADGSIIVSNE